MKFTRLSFLLLSSVCVFACTSAPQLSRTWTLNTTPKSQNYFYCESCPKPTKLANQVYQPLEPDSPIVVAKPVAEPIKISNNPRSTAKSKTHKKHKTTLKPNRNHKKVKPKQCLQWSPQS